MKAFKPDGSRWFAPTALEVMTAWLEQPELLDWLARTRAPWEVHYTDLSELWLDVGAFLDACDGTRQ